MEAKGLGPSSSFNHWDTLSVGVALRMDRSKVSSLLEKEDSALRAPLQELSYAYEAQHDGGMNQARSDKAQEAGAEKVYTVLKEKGYDNIVEAINKLGVDGIKEIVLKEGAMGMRDFYKTH